MFFYFDTILNAVEIKKRIPDATHLQWAHMVKLCYTNIPQWHQLLYSKLIFCSRWTDMLYKQLHCNNTVPSTPGTHTQLHTSTYTLHPCTVYSISIWQATELIPVFFRNSATKFCYQGNNRTIKSLFFNPNNVPTRSMECANKNVPFHYIISIKSWRQKGSQNS